MDQLVFKTKQGTTATTSKLVAETFQKRHKDVLVAIDEIVSHLTDFQGPTFGPTPSGAIFHQIDQWVNLGSKKQNNRYYAMNRDAFTQLIMGFTGKKAAEFKQLFISRFNEMEKDLKNLQQSAPPINLLEHTARPVQIQNSKTVNSYHKNKSGMYLMIDHNRQNCLLHTGKRPNEIVKAAKDEGMPSKWRTSAKEVLRHTAPHKACAMSMADQLVGMGIPLGAASEATRQAEGVFKTLLQLNVPLASVYLN